MGCSGCTGLVLLGFLGLCNGQGNFWRVSSLAPQHRYDCGEYGMQLLVFRSQGQNIRFKVVDEFRTAFEVTNCSSCLHWITSNEDGAAIFSAGYNGCHVLKKDGRNHLKVQIEELARNGRVAATHDIDMVCPKPEHIPTPDGNMHHVPPQPGPVRPRPAQPQPGPVRPRPAQPQPGPVRPRPAQPQPGPVRPQPAQPQPPQPGPLPQLYPSIYNIGSPLTQEQCQVSSGKVPCAVAQGPAACYQAGCCYNEGDQTAQCYYGNTVTVQCLQDGHFILVVSRHMLDYPVILESVRLSYTQAGCDPMRRTEDFLVFHFPLTQCGTTVQVTGGRLIYENQLVSGIAILSGPDGSITRDSTFILHARCIYNAADFLPVQAEVLLPPTPAPVSQMGPLRLELRIATDVSYKSYYSDGNYPVMKVLGDPVYMEVRILQRMDPSLVLVLHDCWATPSTNPFEQLQWPILVDGCPFEGDNYRTQRVPLGPASSELPFPTHYQRFIISTFTFVESGSQVVLDGLVYLFCSVSVCYPSPLEPCRTSCQRPVASRSRRFLEISNGTESLDLISTYGAVIFQESSHYQEKQVKGEKNMVSSVNVTLMYMVVLSLLGVILFVAVLVVWKKSRTTSRMTKL